MNKEIIIKTEHISKAYRLYNKNVDRLKEALDPTKKVRHRLHYALQDISFEVHKGETVGIIGTNGSGKSTLLKILTGVLTPTSGTAMVNGKISALLELGAGFNPDYTGMQNIYLNGTMMNYTEEEMKEKIPAIIQFAEIGEFIDQPVRTYSSGMFARLAFAVAINVEPDILIVDEALSVGDAFFQNKCYRKFEEMRSRDITILFVSHDVSTVKQLCSRTLWIEQGEQRMFGDSLSVCNAYFNEITARQNAVNETYRPIEHKEHRALKETQDEIFCPAIEVRSDAILSDSAEILSVYVTDENGDVTRKMQCGSRYTATVLVKSKVDEEQAIVGVLFEDCKGLFVLSDNTYAHGGDNQNFKLEKNKIVKVEFSFALPQVRGGTYLVTCAVSSGTQENHIVLTWLHGAITVEIERKGYDLALVSADFEMKLSKVKKVTVLSGEYS